MRPFLLQVEVEEEFLTNTLQKKLEKVRTLLQAGMKRTSAICNWWSTSRIAASLATMYTAAAAAAPPLATMTMTSFAAAFSKAVSCCNACVAQLNKEKVDLENRLEAEQEYVVNKLCKQVS
jgi:hypothetical protein